MKMGKWVIIICLLVIPLFGCKQRATISCKLTCEGEVLLEKEYDLSFIDSVKMGKEGGMEREYRKSGKSAMEFLRRLNSSLPEDISRCCEKVTIEKREPEIRYLGDGMFEYAQGSPGRAASPDEVAALLIARGGRLSDEVPTRKVSTVLSEEDLRKHCEKTAAFSCEYGTSSEARKHNIALAVQKLDNAVVASGEELSFNQTVGKRTKENGFREAVVIMNGVFTQGVGGGVCQVSTTLYNAWMLAGLDADSKNHSLAVSYVPIGLDAMVSETSDLVLRNDSAFPVYLDAECDGETVSFTVYGTPTGESIRLWSRQEEVFPCYEYDIIDGEEEKILSEPKPGSRYRSFRDRYKNGVLVRREELRESRYLPTRGKKIAKTTESDGIKTDVMGHNTCIFSKRRYL